MIRLAYILIGLGLVTGIGSIYSVYFAVRQQHKAARKRFRLQTGDWPYWYWADFVNDPFELYRSTRTFSIFRSSVVQILEFSLMTKRRKQIERLRIDHPIVED